MQLSFKLLRHQQRQDGSFPVCIAVSHQGKTAYIQTEKVAQSYQVSKTKHRIVIKDNYLLREVLDLVLSYQREAESVLECSAAEMAATLKYRMKLKRKSEEVIDFLTFCRGVIERLKKRQELGSARNFLTLVNSIEDYTGRGILFTAEINTKFLSDFREFLLSERRLKRMNQGKVMTTIKPPLSPSSLYNRMKDLRTLFYMCRSEYNNEDEGLILIPQNPFSRIKLSQPAPVHRGLTMIEIASLYNPEATGRDKLGNDVFFLSFFLAGMNISDLYSLPLTSLSKGRITYNRAKTKKKRKDHALISIKVEPIVMHFAAPYMDKDRLFDFHKRYSTINNFTKAVNYGLSVTSYVARHSWATIARNECGISKDDISLALNHSTGSVTDIYLKKDWSIIDRANRKIVALFESLLSPPQRASLPFLLLTNED